MLMKEITSKRETLALKVMLEEEKRDLLVWMESHLWTMVGFMFVPTKGIKKNLSLLLVPIRFSVLLKPSF